MPALSSTVLSILTIVGIIIVILWILLPFAIFGIKDRIEESNELLKKIEEALNRSNQKL